MGPGLARQMLVQRKRRLRVGTSRVCQGGAEKSQVPARGHTQVTPPMRGRGSLTVSPCL